MEYFNPWNERIRLLEIMLNWQDSMQEREDFLSLRKYLELQKQEIVIESSIEAIRSYGLEPDNLAVLTGTVEENPSLGVVLNEDEQLKEGETVMSHVKELFISADDKKELACLNSQEKTVRQTFGAATAVENQSFTLIEDENATLEELDLISKINQ